MKIRERGLAMKLARVEQLFDGSRLAFFFYVGRPSGLPRTRAGARLRVQDPDRAPPDRRARRGEAPDRVRHVWPPALLQQLAEVFEPGSIKMAKQQDLALNPSRLSGLCGRLKCCLRYELPNAKGETFAGPAHETACSGGCSCGGCGRGGCGGSCGACGSPDR